MFYDLNGDIPLSNIYMNTKETNCKEKLIEIEDFFYFAPFIL